MKTILFKIFTPFIICSSLSASYFEEAGLKYGINPQLLWAIAKKENPKFNPKAIGKNKNGTIDIGLMQINSIHLPELATMGITKDDLFDPKTNIKVGALILSRCLKKHGENVKGITCYNGRIKNNPYGKDVLKIYHKALENNK